MKNAVVLLSGGLDSATVLAMAVKRGFVCYALSIDYGQRHQAELLAAQRVASSQGARELRVVRVDLTGFGGSALTDSKIAIPESPSAGIPSTYVPARNTIMLSLALAWAEVLQAQDIFVGINAVDYSGYPDCRPDYIAAFERMANLATKAAIEGHPLTIHSPLLYMSKGQIIVAGTQLGVDYAQTVSCYQADGQGRACRVCDSCRLRSAGFLAAGIIDPTLYRSM